MDLWEIDVSEILKKTPILSKEVNINSFQEKPNAQQKCRNLAKNHENTKNQQISRVQSILGNQFLFCWKYKNMQIRVCLRKCGNSAFFGENMNFSRKLKLSKVIPWANIDNFLFKVGGKREAIFHNFGQAQKLFELCRISFIVIKIFEAGNFVKFSLKILKLLSQKLYFQRWIYHRIFVGLSWKVHY